MWGAGACYTGGPRWRGEETSIISSGGVEAVKGLRSGVDLRGDRARMMRGLNEDSSTDGATYVKPWKTMLALSLRVDSSGESMGVCLVNFVSNCETSSSPDRAGLKGGSRRRLSTSAQ